MLQTIIFISLVTGLLASLAYICLRGFATNLAIVSLIFCTVTVGISGSILLIDNLVNNLEDPICEDAYSAGYRHGYANHTSLQEIVQQQYQECYIRGYTKGLEDYQNNIGGQP